jgi:predicted exporter
VLRKAILRNRIYAFLWVIGVCALSGWLILRAPGGAMINADLLALLPQAERDPVIHGAVNRVNKRFEQRVVMLVGAPTFTTAKNAAKHVHENLTETGQFRHLRLAQDGDLVQRMISFYAPLRFQLLGNRERTQLLAGDIAAFERTVLRRYYSPQSAISSRLIENDPFLLLPSFLEQGAAQTIGRSQIRDGFLTAGSDDKTYIVLLGELSGSPFSLSLQRKLMPSLDKLRSDLPENFPGAAFLMAGVNFDGRVGIAAGNRPSSMGDFSVAAPCGANIDFNRPWLPGRFRRLYCGVRRNPSVDPRVRGQPGGHIGGLFPALFL